MARATTEVIPEKGSMAPLSKKPCAERQRAAIISVFEQQKTQNFCSDGLDEVRKALEVLCCHR